MTANLRSSVDAAYRDYYDAASDEDLAEETAWAAFAETLPSDDYWDVRMASDLT